MKQTFFDLTKKVVLLTGGLGFLGKHFARYLVTYGATVLILDVPDYKTAKTIMQTFFTPAEKKRITYFQADITNKAELVTLHKIIIKRYKKIDVLINNAALNPAVRKNQAPEDDSFENFNLDKWQKMFDVNVTGTMLCCQVFGSAMHPGGSIINLASLYGIQAPDQRIYKKGFTKPVSYSVTKGGVVMLTRYLAAYWGPKGIRVNSLSPGGIEADQDKDFVEKFSFRTPLGRMGKVEELGGMLVYLASDSSSYTTGANMIIDGGITVW